MRQLTNLSHRDTQVFYKVMARKKEKQKTREVPQVLFPHTLQRVQLIENKLQVTLEEDACSFHQTLEPKKPEL